MSERIFIRDRNLQKWEIYPPDDKTPTWSARSCSYASLDSPMVHLTGAASREEIEKQIEDTAHTRKWYLSSGDRTALALGALGAGALAGVSALTRAPGTTARRPLAFAGIGVMLLAASIVSARQYPYRKGSLFAS